MSQHKIYGKRRAVVTNIVAPENRMKAQVRLIAEWADVPASALPWAEYLLPVDRAFVPTKVGDLVWVEFPYDGDSRRPLIVGAAQDWSGGIANVPPEASGVGEQYKPPELEGAPAASAARPTEDMVMKRDGILIARTGSGSYSITRIADHTTIAISDAGKISISSASDIYVNAGGNMKVISAGNVEAKVGGNASITAGGKMDFKAASLSFTAGSIAFNKG